MDIIKELFMGNIAPDIAIGQNEEYKKASNVFNNLATAFRQTHNEKTTEKLCELLEAYTNMTDIENTETFKVGFTLGVRLMCACFFND
ncbi:MAG: hypothetical protein IJA60_06855 [Clostridia bacterium]|nr:hypothetical protein [Clostridia bacterium]